MGDKFDSWLEAHGCAKSKTWIRIKKDGSVNFAALTLQSYIRNKVHHPENHHNEAYSKVELKESIDGLRG